MIASLLTCLSSCHSGQQPTDPQSTVEIRTAVRSQDQVQLQPGLAIEPDTKTVLLEAEICLREGWLEQVVCSPGTREHESIMVTSVEASALHAALLAAGQTPGRPGAWRWEGDRVHLDPPAGSSLEVMVSEDRLDWVPLLDWITNSEGRSPKGHWVFGGSTFRKPNSVPVGTSLYEADLSGSIIGLVTFGDETLGFSAVIPDEVDAAPEEWRARTRSIPEIGTTVHVRVRPLSHRR